MLADPALTEVWQDHLLFEAFLAFSVDVAERHCQDDSCCHLDLAWLQSPWSSSLLLSLPFFSHWSFFGLVFSWVFFVWFVLMGPSVVSWPFFLSRGPFLLLLSHGVFFVVMVFILIGSFCVFFCLLSCLSVCPSL